MSSFWTPKDGETIATSDMDTSHIINTMKYLEKNNYETTEYISFGGNQGGDESITDHSETYERMRLELRLRKIEEKE